MKEIKNWSWGFVPVIAALACIWFEYWQAGRHERPAEISPAIATIVTRTVPLDPRPAATVSSRPATAPTVEPTQPQSNLLAPLIPIQEVDPRLFTEPPPISLTVSQATLPELAKALSASLNMPGTIATQDPRDLRFSLDIKNKPFWDIFQFLQNQTPFMILRVLKPDIRPARFPRRHPSLPAHGPAILFARSLAYTRSGPDGTFTLTLGAFIDPRLHVVKRGPITILNAVDDQGRVQPIPEAPVGDNLLAISNNYWTQSTSWPAISRTAKSITFQCQIVFAAESICDVAWLDDAEKKSGESVTLGDLQIRLPTLSWASPNMRISATKDSPGNQPSIVWTLQDSAGKTWSSPSTTASSLNIPAPDAKPPFRLILKSTRETRSASYQFELPEIPVP